MVGRGATHTRTFEIPHRTIPQTLSAPSGLGFRIWGLGLRASQPSCTSSSSCNTSLSHLLLQHLLVSSFHSLSVRVFVFVCVCVCVCMWTVICFRARRNTWGSGWRGRCTDRGRTVTPTDSASTAYALSHALKPKTLNPKPLASTADALSHAPRSYTLKGIPTPTQQFGL